ncbi:metallophosphoesterase family protein [Candidatus Leptofilum sp.]|uniref:metallophosphoesterase family protein n=1 Tax=Candidatus Leptofilum sp. TaxID=3241576 RepID=UPI003B5921C1
MKIAVISDIHGNMPALEIVTADIEKWQPDQVIVDGDIVNRGPLSRASLEWVLAKQASDNWQIVKGNHEDYVLECAAANGSKLDAQYQVRQFAHWAYEQVAEYVPIIANLPEQYSVFAPDGSELRVVHGSMRDNRDGIYPQTSDRELREQIAPAPKLFVTGHTHRPLIRHVDATTVVNIGSVGASFDGNRELSYGRFTWQAGTGWAANIVRLPYDFDRVEQDYETSGFLAEAGPLAQLMLVELRRAGGLVYRWASRHQEAVLAGEISMVESVRAVLQDEDLRPYLGAPGWSLATVINSAPENGRGGLQ